MPNWMDMFGATMRPLVPKQAVSGLREALAPGSSADINAEEDWSQIPGAIADLLSSGVENPGAALGGFASGALEGLRGMTTPLDLASLAGPAMLGKVASQAAPLADDAIRYGRQAFDTVERIPPRQSMPSMEDVNAIIGDAQRQMARVPNATGQLRRPGLQRPPAPGPEFVPRGGEAAFNAGRPKMAGPDINLPPPRLGRGPRVPQPVPTPEQMSRQVGMPVSPVADPVGDNLARIEQALRDRFSQMGQPSQGYGRGPR